MRYSLYITYRSFSVLIFLLTITFFTFGQQNSLERLIRANSHPFSIQNGNLSGEGAEMLASSMDNVQFVALGEPHNRRSVYQFGGALFRLLNNQHGFNYLALEEDPYLGRLSSLAARRGGREELIKLALRYPNAFHYLTENELEMIGTIGKMSTAPTEPIWGLNQVFGTTHIAERLVRLAPDANARAAAQMLLNAAMEYEKERFQKNRLYIAFIAKPDDFERLRKAFRAVKGSEADFLITQLALSNRVFSPYAAKPRPASEFFYESGVTRDTNAKHLFGDRYREAQMKGVKLPKVMAMFGHYHLYRGISENDVFTLGNYLSELATFNRMRSLHIYAAVDLPEVRQGWQGTIVRAIEGIGEKSSDGVVIDLRPLKPLALRRNPDSAGLDPNISRLILNYDVFVFLRDGEQGSLKRLQTPNFRWYGDQS